MERSRPLLHVSLSLHTSLKAVDISTSPVEIQFEKAQAQSFLTFLQALLLAGRPRFRLEVDPVGLIVGLVIGGAVSTGGEVFLDDSYERC